MLKGTAGLISITCAFIFSLFIFLEDAAADVVVLENGDSLTGTVTKMEKDILTLTTEYSHKIQIKKSKIKSITTDNPVNVYLINGEILKGRLAISEDGSLLMESSTGRETTIVDLRELTSINPTPLAPSKWDGNITLGAGKQSGNTDRSNVSVGAEATRKTDKDRFGLRFLFNYAQENDVMTTRNTYGSLKYDYFFTRPLFGYVSVEMLNDRFKDLSLRTVVGPGFGYQVWNNKIRSLLFEAGVSYFSENLSQGEDSSWTTARLASIFHYKILNKISFTNHIVIYPSLQDFGEYQLRNEAGISSDLGYNLALNFTNILERDSNPPLDVMKSDLQWILGLKYSF